MPDQPVEMQMLVPAELEVGEYANVLSVWHSPHDFTLDFAITQPAAEPEEGEPIRVPCRVVSRVRIPTTVMFDVLRAINQNMTQYEEQFGEIKRPGASADSEERSDDDV